MARVIYTLRDATWDDLELVQSIYAAIQRPYKAHRRAEERLRVRQKFRPENIKIVQHDDVDVGRYRLVTEPGRLYVGGIHLFPQYQRLGIGSAIFSDLLEMSRQANLPVELEVHWQNHNAQRFYQRHEFLIVGIKILDEQDRYLRLMRFPKQ